MHLWSAEHYICHSAQTVAMQKNTSSDIINHVSVSSLETVSLDEIRRNIALTTTQLLELTHRDDKLHHTISRLNHLGLKNIHNHHEQQALAYFNECERILEYAASCGKTIDRSLIIAVLNNQALLYHKTNDIETAYNYLQAILYNLRLFIDAPQNNLLQSQLQRLASVSTAGSESQQFIEQNFQEIKSLFERKQQLAIFYLRFSGLNSQRQMHNESLRNAKQSLKQMKQLCKMCYNFQKITTPNNPQVKMLMKELSCLDDDLTVEDMDGLREELRRLYGGFVDNNQIYSQAYQSLNAQNKQEVMETDVHSLFDLEPIFIPDNVLQNSNHNIELCSSYFMQVSKVLYIMGAYFAIAVETQEIECPQHLDNSNIQEVDTSIKLKTSVAAEMAYLYSLITGFKYLPRNIKLTNYLYSLYCQTYPSAFTQNCESPVVSQIFQPATPPNTKTMQQNLNQLKEKYKNYIVEKQMDLSDSMSKQDRKLKDSKGISNWQQEKKQSKKLTDLLKPEPSNFLAPPNQYLSEVQYIDSFEMANSRSATQNSVSIGMKTISSQDQPNNQSKKEKKGLTLKQITECQSQMLEETQKLGKMVGKFSANPKTIPNEIHMNKKIKNREASKSKSVKHINSKSKDPKAKVSAKKNVSIYTIPSAGALHSVNTTNRKAISKSKSLSKNKNQMTTTNASEQKKVVKIEKKRPIMGSERIKYSHNINPLASVKNYQSIKFNKVKSPTIVEERNTKITSVINQKNQKRQTKKSTSSKKMSSKSLSLAKSQNKQLSNTAKLKIYTSVGWNKSKKN